MGVTGTINSLIGMLSLTSLHGLALMLTSKQAEASVVRRASSGMQINVDYACKGASTPNRR